MEDIEEKEIGVSPALCKHFDEIYERFFEAAVMHFRIFFCSKNIQLNKYNFRIGKLSSDKDELAFIYEFHNEICVYHKANPYILYEMLRFDDGDTKDANNIILTYGTDSYKSKLKLKYDQPSLPIILKVAVDYLNRFTMLKGFLDELRKDPKSKVKSIKAFPFFDKKELWIPFSDRLNVEHYKQKKWNMDYLYSFVEQYIDKNSKQFNFKFPSIKFDSAYKSFSSPKTLFEYLVLNHINKLDWLFFADPNDSYFNNDVDIQDDPDYFHGFNSEFYEHLFEKLDSYEFDHTLNQKIELATLTIYWLLIMIRNSYVDDNGDIAPNWNPNSSDVIFFLFPEREEKIKIIY